MSKNDKPPELPATYYCTGDKCGSFWFTLPDQAIIRLGQDDLARWLMSYDVSTSAPRGELSDLDRFILRTQHHNRVAYAGALAGHRKGILITSSGHRILVTEESKAYEAPSKLGKTTFWMTFLKALLKEQEQVDAILDWWSCSLKRLMKGEFGPGQALVLTGPPGCGKSLAQHLTTEILGGRKADPFRYMMGATQFNADLAEAEHLMIEDKSASIDIRTRREFGARLKEMTVNRDMSVHPKGGKAITLHTFRRVTITVNDEVENLAILPPLDRSILDKLMILKCHPAADTLESSEPATWKRFQSELPAMRAMLMRREIPKSRAHGRMGVKPFHNEEILASATTLEPHERLLSIIDHVLCEDLAKGPEKFSSESLEIRLRKSDMAFALDRICHGHSAVGSLMGKLAERHPKRVERRASKGKVSWYIFAPDPED